MAGRVTHAQHPPGPHFGKARAPGRPTARLAGAGGAPLPGPSPDEAIRGAPKALVGQGKTSPKPHKSDTAIVSGMKRAPRGEGRAGLCLKGRGGGGAPGQSQSGCRAVTGDVKAVGGGGFWRLEMRLRLVLRYGNAFGVESVQWGGGRGVPPPRLSSDSLGAGEEPRPPGPDPHDVHRPATHHSPPPPPTPKTPQEVPIPRGDPLRPCPVRHRRQKVRH